jgi:hypothetical protein
VVTGSATNERIKGILDTCESNGETSILCERACKKDRPSPRIAFHATTVSDDVRFRELANLLKDRYGVVEDSRGVLKEVALLKESGTAYAERRIPDAGAPHDADGVDPELVLTFPPHISNVARAYDATEKSKPDDSVSTLTRNLEKTLTPSLEEPAEPRDEFPALSPRTVYSNDLMIAQEIELLVERRVRFVVLMASDRNDVVFLAHQIHRRNGDMRIIVVGSEVLYSHPQLQVDTAGMLVVSPYPLIDRDGEDDGDGGPPRARRRFSNEQEEGVYNAAVTLLAKPDLRFDYECDEDASVACVAPRLWIATIGKGLSLPVDARPIAVDEKDYSVDGTRRAPPLPTVRTGWWWDFTVWFSSLFSIYVAVLAVGRAVRHVATARFPVPGE